MLRYGKIIEKLNIDEKLAILTDANALAGLSAEKEGVPYMSMARLSDFYQAEGYLTYPSFEALANAWDVKSAAEVAKGLSLRAREAGVNTALIPKSNLRSNVFLDGATEDPYLMGALTREWISASESVGVKPIISTCAMRNEDCAYADVQPNAKAIMEYYLRPFRIAMQGRGDVAVITSHEPLQGEYEKVNLELVKSLLEKQIAKKSTFVISEKTSAGTAVSSFNAGYSLTLKGHAEVLKEAVTYYQSICEAMESGVATADVMETALREGYALSTEMIDEGVDAVLCYAFAVQKQADFAGGEYKSLVNDYEKERAKERVSDAQAPSRGIGKAEMLAIAEKTAVLLKNERGALPLKPRQRVAVIGALGKTAAEYVQKHSGNGWLGYAAGYDLQRARSDDQLAEAEALAKSAETVLLFVGFGKEKERKLSATKCLQLPGTQMLLIEKLAALGKKIVAVVMGSGRVDMRFDCAVDAVLYVPEMGSCMGEAVANLLYGTSNPSGKLAFTMYDAPEQRIQQEKFYKDKGYNKVGTFVGYRRYVSDGEQVKYPFGHGLSYTRFRYTDFRTEPSGVRLTIKNVGSRAGDEIVQFYYEKPDSDVLRPAKELFDFERVHLKPGQSITIHKQIKNSSFAVYYPDSGEWLEEKGTYKIYAASSVEKEQLCCNYQVIGTALQKTDEHRSDYLQSHSNIVSGGYFMDTNIKHIKHKGTGLVLGLLALIFAALYDVFAFIFSPQIRFFQGDIGQITALVLFIVLNLLAIIGFVGILVWAKRRKRFKRESAKTPLKHDESIEEEEVSPVPYARLFAEEFGEDEEEIFEEEAEEEEQEISFVVQEETDSYHRDGWTFTQMYQELIAFAAEYGVLLDAAQARTLLSAMSVSRLVVLKFDKDANADLFLEMLSAFFGVQCFADNAKKYATADDIFFHSEDNGAVRTNFLSALEEAAADHFAVKLTHLTSVRLNALGGYFTQLMRYVVKPETPYAISFKNKTLTDQTFTTSQNLWIFLTLYGEEMVENLPAYIAETAAFIKVKYVQQEGAEEKSKRAPISVAQFLKFGDKARNHFELDEGKWKYVDKLEEYVKARVDYRLSNKMWQKMERYASCYLALGGEPATALDSVIAVKMLTTVLNLIKHNKKEGDDKFFNVISNLFGEEDVDACRMVIDASAVDAEEGWEVEASAEQDEQPQVSAAMEPVAEEVPVTTVEEPVAEETAETEEIAIIEEVVEQEAQPEAEFEEKPEVEPEAQADAEVTPADAAE